MDLTITPASAAALFAAMALLASVPGTSALAVSARAAGSGFGHGAAVTAGIVLGDVVFILVAFLGLQLVAGAAGELFVLVEYAAGGLLVAMGLALWRSRPAHDGTGGDAPASLRSSFLAGLLITLADQKAVLFYLGFLPAFVDLARASALDAGAVLAITAVAVGGPKLGYAWVAGRAGALAARPGVRRALERAAAALMVAVGIVLIVRG